ncbi:hypothetical protein KKB64_02355 [Patescibacteria group bacterium]|nr:hypothetical protein [Patescibacteria group bacterium]MBU1472611.1 hypothetical protein [Patescibacteria group bacterium]MBU2459862.1 hypothetical protein [Patescibacteria group bacterium]MBU2544077.1 hypothetical protein [Patescibacteria group bacterium]
MAKRKVLHAKTTSRYDLSSWNFIIFLTLAFILMVVVLTQMRNTSLSLQSRAGLACPQIDKLPRAEDCGSGWVFKRDTNGCPTFFCEPTPTVKTKK